MAAPRVAAGVEIDGLAELVRACRRIDRDAAKELVGVLRDETKKVQADAKGRARDTSRSAPSRTSWIGRTASSRSAGVSLLGSRDPRAWATEWGSRTHMLFGRRIRQTRLSRRTFAPWRGNQFVVRGRAGPGWVIQAAIRSRLPQAVKVINKELYRVWSGALTRAGVPRG